MKKPMYFKSLMINNVKSFGHDVVLDLTDDSGAISPWTLLLGDNGVGKTTLLKCIAWMTPVVSPEDEKISTARKLKVSKVQYDVIKKVTGLSKKDIEQLDVDSSGERTRIKPAMDDIEDNSRFERVVRVGGDSSAKISATLSLGVSLREIPEEQHTVTHGLNIVLDENRNLTDVIIQEADLEEFNSPNLFAYSANRHMAAENIEKTELASHVSNLFSESGDLYDAEEVLRQLDHAASKQIPQSSSEELEGSKGDQPGAVHLLAKVKQILADILPDIDSPDSILVNPPMNPEKSRSKGLVQVITPYGKVPLAALSLGYKTMLAWVVDLAIRMLWNQPELDNPLEQPAVVIVDEIDLHLHPKWQRVLREYLIKHFPNTQFICTAHSPIMAQSSEEENLAVLIKYEDEVHIENRPEKVKGWRIGQVITNLFDVSERSPEITKKVEERRNLLDKEEQSDEDKERLTKLDEELSDLPIGYSNDDESLLNQIRQAADILRKEGKI